MKQREMEQAFDEVYKGNKNFMTPTIERYEQIGNMFIVEISSGSGMLGFDTLYGATVLANVKDVWVKYDTLNKMLKSKEEVNQYITFLNDNVNLVNSLSIPQCLVLIGAVEVTASLDEIEKEMNDILNNIDLPHIDSDT